MQSVDVLSLPISDPPAMSNLLMASAARSALLGKGARQLFCATRCLRAMLHK